MKCVYMSDSDPLSEMNFCFVLRNVKGSYIIQLFVPSVTWRRSKSFFSIYQQTSKVLCVRLAEYVKLWVALDESDHHSCERNTKGQIEGQRAGKEEVCFCIRDSERVYLCDAWFKLVYASSV